MQLSVICLKGFLNLQVPFLKFPFLSPGHLELPENMFNCVPLELSLILSLVKRVPKESDSTCFRPQNKPISYRFKKPGNRNYYKFDLKKTYSFALTARTISVPVLFS